MIPYGKRHPVVLRWISIKNLSPQTFLTIALNTVYVMSCKLSVSAPQRDDRLSYFCDVFVLLGQPYYDNLCCCTDHFEDSLNVADIADFDSADGLRNSFYDDVINDAALSSSRDSLSRDFSRYDVSFSQL